MRAADKHTERCMGLYVCVRHYHSACFYLEEKWAKELWLIAFLLADKAVLPSVYIYNIYAGNFICIAQIEKATTSAREISSTLFIQRTRAREQFNYVLQNDVLSHPKHFIFC